jgi:hypothetical protein
VLQLKIFNKKAKRGYNLAAQSLAFEIIKL